MQRWASRCINLILNPWVVFPSFRMFSSYCLPQTAHNFTVILRVVRTILWLELLMHYATAEENSEQNLDTWSNLASFFWFLALLRSFIGIIVHWFGCHTLTLMIHQQLINSNHHWRLPTAPELMRRFLWSKLSNLGTFFADTHLMLNKSKINSWHEWTDMPTASATPCVIDDFWKYLLNHPISEWQLSTLDWKISRN